MNEEQPKEPRVVPQNRAYDGGYITIGQAAARMSMSIGTFRDWMRDNGLMDDQHETRVKWRTVERKRNDLKDEANRR